ncbi:FadR/GntR family transcriptional regulator [Enemella evansiae]|uniref:FadR/GntR family transcriptional regulator n=1 Tax=Enemella evansiae TaxID=2016499 RepID=UPI001E282645|nr:FCD domain-containing protein [Enemella evansiae]
MSADRRTARPLLQEQVRSLLTDYIVEHGLGPGDPLPTEQELMREFGVGRNVLREGLKALQALGIVEVRHGYGTFVGNAGLTALERGLHFRAAMSLRAGLGELRDLLDVREALEVGLAARVVAAVDDAQLAALEEIVQGMQRAAVAGDYFPELDWRFHETLYAPLGNALVTDLLRVFWRVFGDVEAQLPGARYTPVAAAGWHAGILAAVRQQDVGATQRAVATHFADIRERLGRA